MKIFLLLFLLLFGCNENHLLDELENGFYDLDEVYVIMDEKEVQQLFDMNENDCEDYIALKTLVVYEQKEIFVFFKPSDHLKKKLVNDENYILLEIDNYLYYGINDPVVLDFFKQTLNK